MCSSDLATSYAAEDVNRTSGTTACAMIAYRGTAAVTMASHADCIACDAGAYCPVGAAQPTLCAPGAFAAESVSALCTVCPPGDYQDESGATACKGCPPGSACPGGGSTHLPWRAAGSGPDDWLRRELAFVGRSFNPLSLLAHYFGTAGFACAALL